MPQNCNLSSCELFLMKIKVKMMKQAIYIAHNSLQILSIVQAII